ncbi:hypothetical protein SAMN06265222_102303 [Neorhodopirellula lusitana]|uniref:Uncharacterized protein n=1 Tax=Neorhodopirellula lusitana TaxID=445327 RepID=A0ABY1PUF4_9BACT|nr:hypothetical protein SAMN06265222_102303 [Neorhodopirellula lusitana]
MELLHQDTSHQLVSPGSHNRLQRSRIPKDAEGTSRVVLSLLRSPMALVTEAKNDAATRKTEAAFIPEGLRTIAVGRVSAPMVTLSVYDVFDPEGCRSD